VFEGEGERRKHGGKGGSVFESSDEERAEKGEIIWENKRVTCFP